MKMKKIKKFKISIVIIIFVMIFAPTETIAWGGSASGNGGGYAGCGGSYYCVAGAGLRFSIYKYAGTGKPQKQGKSFDVWDGDYYNPNVNFADAEFSDPTKNCSDPLVKKHDGKLASNDCFSLSRSEYKAKKQYMVKNNIVYDYTTQSQSFINRDLEGKNGIIKNYFSSSEGIKKYFGVTIDGDPTQYYLVVETLFRIRSSYYSPIGEYVGTGFESLGLDPVHDYPHCTNYGRFVSWYATSLTTTHTVNKLVAEKGGYLKPAKSGSTLDGRKGGALSNRVYAMAIYKLDEVVDDNCATRCAKRDVKNKYLCAMSFCDGTSDREKCVKACNITDPGFNCSNNSSTKSLTDTKCTDKTTGEVKTCTKGYTNTDVSKRVYYYTECTETNDVKFKGSLPATITPGEGFSYNLNLTGKKVCTTKFDIEKFNYDYATADPTTRNQMETLFRNYQNLSTIPNTYKYDINNSKFTFKAKEVINKENKTSSDIVLEKIKNIDGDNSIKKASTQEDSGTYYTVTDSDFKKSVNSGKLVMGPYSNLYNKTYKNKTYISDMSGEYGLPGVCLNAKGKTYSPTYQASENKYVCIDENKKRKNNEGPYRKYYTNIKSTPSDNKTYVYINKAGSISSDVKNTCNYIVSDKNLDCMITKDSTHYLLHILSNQKIDYSKYKYNFSINVNSTNFGTIDGSSNIIAKKLLNSDSLSASEISKYGKVIYGRIVSANNVNEVLAKCEYNLDRGSGDACKELYKPNQHDEICKYCQDNYNTDKENYPTAKACEQDCGTNKCRQIYQCTDTENIKEYCNSQYSDEKQRSVCINDCSCKNDYLYRPISLTNPFPNNRTAGSNWLGYETTINDGSENDTPEYVVKLTTADIRRINDSTNYINNQVNKTTKKKLDAYTDYIWYGRADQNGPYRSNFINNEFSGLFCIKLGVGSCDG